MTSTSLLAVGRSFDLAARMLADHPGLDVGAHLAIVGEDPPLLSAREIPTLVDRRGAFPLSYRTVVRRGAGGPARPRRRAPGVRRAAGADPGRGRRGVAPGHPSAHAPVAGGGPGRRWSSAAEGRGVPAVRTPRSGRLLPVGRGQPALRPAAAAGRAGPAFAPPTAYAGLDEAGAMDAAAFRSAVTGLAGSLPVTGAIGGDQHPPGRGR